MKRTRVFIIDDHPVVFQGLRALLNQEKRLEVCGYAQDAQAAFSGIEQKSPDLAIVDISLQDGVSGLDLMKQLSATFPELKILSLSMHDESVYSERAIRAGAHGYVMKSELINTLVKAIDQVMQGNVYLSEKTASKLLKKMVKHGEKAAVDITEQLTNREFEVFSLIGEGYKTRGIAERLYLSPKTVETYRMRIREKLQLNDSAELTLYAVSWTREHP